MRLIESKPITFREVFSLLSDRKKETAGAELGYEQANTLAYAEAFGAMTEAKEESLRKELSKISPSLPQTAVVAFLNLLPRKEEEIRAVLQWAKADIPEEQVKELAKAFKKQKKA
ncbi:hypothetical protein HY995_01625 [Candidatus Micrarchaeota archaeon]|nr:hypothetical protein [Candidatus Micrarchaeota archaeon]MBI5176767.1 hypothetical protein [Candidatus Micrarchaeota archaeon]